MTDDKRRLGLLGLLFIATASLAQQTPPLGRLFFSPAQRAALDAMRDAPQPIVPDAKPSPPATTPQAGESIAVSKPPSENKAQREQVRRNPVLTGFVERSSGANTVWIDRQAKQIKGGYGELDPVDVGKARRQ